MPNVETLNVDPNLHSCLFSWQASFPNHESPVDALADIYFQNWQNYYYVTPPASELTTHVESLGKLNGFCGRDTFWIGGGEAETNLSSLLQEAATRAGHTITASDTVVDLGGGVGLVSAALLMNFGPMKIYSVDLDPAAGETLKRANADMAQSSQLGSAYADSVVPVTADVTKLPREFKAGRLPAPGTVDVVTAMDISKILVGGGADLPAYYKGILKLLKRGGVFVDVEVPPPGRDNAEYLRQALSDSATAVCGESRCKMDIAVQPLPMTRNEFMVITWLRRK